MQCEEDFERNLDSDNRMRYGVLFVSTDFIQRPDIDFDEIASPVVRHCTRRMLFALSVQLDLNVTKTSKKGSELFDPISIVKKMILCWFLRCSKISGVIP